MRKRNIKTLAHWLIMSVILLFPVLMVMASNKAEDSKVVTINYKYETNNVESEEDLIVGNIYHFEFNAAYDYLFNQYEDPYLDFAIINLETFSVNDLGINDIFIDEFIEYDYENSSSFCEILFNFDNMYFFAPSTVYDYSLSFNLNTFDVHGTFEFSGDIILIDKHNIYESLYQYFSKCENIPIESVNIEEMSLKDEINQWSAEFLDLPVNAWYKQLTNAMNFPITSNSVMNIIYIYPLYVIWVYVFDLIADIFLVIVKLGHNLLEKVGGGNE